MWEDGLAAIERALGKVHMKHDVSRDQAEVVK
jgi:hypothetical protein